MRTPTAARCTYRFSILPLLIGSAAVVAAQSAWEPCLGTLGESGWQCTTVDAAGELSSLSRLAYTPDGSPLIAYSPWVKPSKGLQGGTQSLRVATRAASGTWTMQTIDAKEGGPSALRINPVTGRPGISYACQKLAEFNGTTWAIQTVVARGCDGGGTFAYDQSGRAFAAYTDTKKKLVLGERVGSTWNFQTSSQLASSYKSMAVGPDGQPAIAFENFGTALMFGRREPGGIWQFTLVDPELPVPSGYISYVELVFDEAGVATVAYHNSKTIRYAREDRASGTWTVENVWIDPESDAFLGAVSLVHAGGEPVVVFQRSYSAQPGELLVSRRIGGQWTAPSPVESFGSAAIPLMSSAVHDGTGLIGISYVRRGSTTTALRFAEGPASALAN